MNLQKRYHNIFIGVNGTPCTKKCKSFGGITDRIHYEQLSNIDESI